MKKTSVAPRVLQEGFKRLVGVLRGHSLHWAVLVSIADTCRLILSKHEQFCKGKPKISFPKRLISKIKGQFRCFSSSSWPWLPRPWPKNWTNKLVVKRAWWESSTILDSAATGLALTTMITMTIMITTKITAFPALSRLLLPLALSLLPERPELKDKAMTMSL